MLTQHCLHRALKLARRNANKTAATPAAAASVDRQKQRAREQTRRFSREQEREHRNHEIEQDAKIQRFLSEWEKEKARDEERERERERESNQRIKELSELSVPKEHKKQHQKFVQPTDPSAASTRIQPRPSSRSDNGRQTAASPVDQRKPPPAASRKPTPVHKPTHSEPEEIPHTDASARVDRGREIRVRTGMSSDSDRGMCESDETADASVSPPRVAFTEELQLGQPHFDPNYDL